MIDVARSFIMQGNRCGRRAGSTRKEEKPTSCMKSIEKKRAEVAAGQARVLPSPQPAKKWYAYMRSPLWICLLAALLVRLWLVYHTRGVVDGDEALLGIQAEHILRGEHPVYFYGQAYMGSLEAYLTALLFAIIGPSVWALRAEPTLLSLLLVWLTWRLAGKLAEVAQLSFPTRRMFQTVAALAAALTPLYDMVVELKTLGGYIETFVLMLWLLLSVFQLTRRWHEGATKQELLLRWAGIGFIIGLGLWVDLLIVSAILTSAAWILGFCALEGARYWREAHFDFWRAVDMLLVRLGLMVAALPALVLGLAPAIYWGYKHQWANVTYALQLGSLKAINIGLRAKYTSRALLIHDQISLYKNYVAPRVISGALPLESAVLQRIHAFTLGIGVLCIIAALLLLLAALLLRLPWLLRLQWLVGMPLLFAFLTALTFCTSTASSAGLLSLQNDLAGRYAAPLALALPFFLATIFLLPALFFIERRRETTAGDGREDASMLAAKARRLRLPVALQVVFIVLLALYLGAQVSSYALTDPAATFQSPSCPIAPANNDPLVAYLEQQHVHYAWALSWIGYPITFKTNDSIITADPRAIISSEGPGRYPAYFYDLMRADRPALVMFVKSNDSYPLFLRYLDSKGITYTAKRFPSEPGTDILALTSLSQTVKLNNSYAFFTAFHSCLAN